MADIKSELEKMQTTLPGMAVSKTDSFIEGELPGPRLDLPRTLCSKMLGEFLEKLINKHGEQRVLAVLEANERLFE